MGLIQTLAGLFSNSGPSGVTGDLSNPQFWLVDMFSGRKTISGTRVTPNVALTYSAYFAAIRSICEDIAKLPRPIFRLEEDHLSRDMLYDDPLWYLLNVQPNPEMTAMVFWETVLQWALSWGGGIAEIERNGAGEVIALWPIHPSRVSLVRGPDQKIYYRVRGNYSADMLVQEVPYQDVDLPAEDVYHIHGLGPMGNSGYSIVRLAAESLGVALATQAFGAAFFGNGTTVSGVLTHPETLSDPAYARLRESWSERYQGAYNSNKPAILEEGMTWVPMSLPPEEAQFLETRQFQVEEIARWFRMPPHKLQQLLQATFSNIESQNIEYADDCLSPWCTRINQETKRKLLTRPNDRMVFMDHDLKDLKKADMATRTKFYQQMFVTGSMSPNEIRSREGMNPIPDGDKYFVQINLTTLENAGELPDPNAVGPDGKPLKNAGGVGGAQPDDDVEKELKQVIVNRLATITQRKALTNGHPSQS